MKPCNRLTAEYSNTRGFSFIFNKEFSNRKGKRTHGRRSRGFPVQDWAKRKFAVLRGRSDEENRTPWTRSGILLRFWWRNTPDHVPPGRSSARIYKEACGEFFKKMNLLLFKAQKIAVFRWKEYSWKKTKSSTTRKFPHSVPGNRAFLVYAVSLERITRSSFYKVDDV